MPKGQMRFYNKVARLRGNSTPVAEAIKNEIPPSLFDRVVMIPNPIPFSDFSKVDFAEKKNVLLYAGRIHPEKGLEILINAFASLSSDWVLKVVGPWEINAGGGGIEYLQLLKKLAGEKEVIFTGPVFDMDALNLLYAEATVFVYPSIAEKGETFGLAPLEAMAWGCVPVVSDLACFKDFISDNINGLVFDHRAINPVAQLKLKMEKIIGDGSLRKQLANKAIDVRISHSTTNLAQRFIQEFEAIRQ
jgi:glycosyltransferase involved in cell wall biosynthesis